ncbi:hypothetical protein GCM10020001_058190 [Nonomuraea salmonea]
MREGVPLRDGAVFEVVDAGVGRKVERHAEHGPQAVEMTHDALTLCPQAMTKCSRIAKAMKKTKPPDLSNGSV